nr:putative ribonuclease H-like domain-containing protein [Tanacetum cinerariifolium]
MTGNISYILDYEPFDGGYVSFGQGGCKITGKGTIKTDLTCLVAKASADECMLWHRRLGHLNIKTMNRLVRHNLVRGLPSKYFDNDQTCIACLKGKQHKASYKTKLVNSVTKPLHTLHMDLFGPTSDETSGILRNFITEIENLKDLKVKIIRCDNGGEFRNKEINYFCSRKGIKREFSNARTPQQNRVAEKRNRTLIEAARTMLADAKLPITFWAEAVNTACYVQNRVLVNKSQNKTPYELFNGRTLSKGFLKPFGCHVMILNTLDDLGKFKAKGDEGYFIGYSMSSKAYRVFNKRIKRVEENLHVDFLENKAIEKGASPNWLFDINSLTKSMNYVPVVVAGTNSTNFSGTKDAASQEVKKDAFEDIHGVTTTSDESNRVEADVSNMETTITASPTPTLRIHKDHPKSQIIGHVDTPIQTRNKSKEMEEQSFIATIHQKTNPALLQFYLFTCFLSQKEPKKISDALKDPSWVEAMQEELLQFKIQNVWSLVDCPKEFPAKVYKVEKAMYGLHQAPRAWYGTLSKYLLTNGFQRGMIDQTLFIRRHRGDFLLVQVYVDDIIFGSSNPLLCREFEALMHEKFQMSAMGELNFFMGLQVTQKEDDIFLSQDKYVGDIFKKFGYTDVRSANTPMDKENPWGKDESGKDVELHLYRSMIGSLMYLTASRPDIIFVVCACARHQVTLKECHLHVIKRIFRYLKGHPKLGLWYLKESPFDLVAHSDSDYGGATQDRKSTTGGCQFLGRRLITWQCKKQTIVATYTIEAKYVAAASGCGQVL